MATIRVLLVEDFKPLRALIAELLSKDPDLKVICEAGDGTEAVAQAQQFQPDVILMDIGLPRLDGLAAGRRILHLFPSAKIIFLTQEADAGVVQEALNLGARGYVLKEYAESDLLTGIAAVLAGKRFVSRGLSGNGVELSKSP